MMFTLGLRDVGSTDVSYDTCIGLRMLRIGITYIPIKMRSMILRSFCSELIEVKIYVPFNINRFDEIIADIKRCSFLSSSVI